MRDTENTGSFQTASRVWVCLVLFNLLAAFVCASASAEENSSPGHTYASLLRFWSSMAGKPPVDDYRSIFDTSGRVIETQTGSAERMAPLFAREVALNLFLNMAERYRGPSSDGNETADAAEKARKDREKEVADLTTYKVAAHAELFLISVIHHAIASTSARRCVVARHAFGHEQFVINSSPHVPDDWASIRGFFDIVAKAQGSEISASPSDCDIAAVQPETNTLREMQEQIRSQLKEMIDREVKTTLAAISDAQAPLAQLEDEFAGIDPHAETLSNLLRNFADGRSNLELIANDAFNVEKTAAQLNAIDFTRVVDRWVSYNPEDPLPAIAATRKAKVELLGATKSLLVRFASVAGDRQPVECATLATEASALATNQRGDLEGSDAATGQIHHCIAALAALVEASRQETDFDRAANAFGAELEQVSAAAVSFLDGKTDLPPAGGSEQRAP